MRLLATAASLLPLIKEKRPLIHHITNFVTINDCANMTLAIGASPIMAVDKAEVKEIVSKASALVLNLGTPTPESIESMLLAGKKANELGVPIILDPVGVGFTKLRSKGINDILNQVKVAVLRGNASEIKYLFGVKADIKGVDSTTDDKNNDKIARDLAAQLGCVVTITGKRDILSDGNKICYVTNGHKILTQITGTGCMISSLIAAFSAVTDNYLTAALGGVLTMGIAGETAYLSLGDKEGPGTLKVKLFDQVYNLTADTITKLGIVI